MEKNSILVLFELYSDLAEGHDDCRGLGLRERGVGYCGGAQGMVAHGSRTGEQQPERIGQAGRRRGAVAAPVPLDRLDRLFALATGTRAVFLVLQL